MFGEKITKVWKLFIRTYQPTDKFTLLHSLALLATHGYPNGNKFEVIDLFNDNSICENLDDDAILKNNDGYWSTGGLVNSLPVLCHYQYCHVLGQSNKIELNENRYQSSSIVVDSKVSCQTIDI